MNHNEVKKLESIAGSSPFYIVDRKRFEANFDDLTAAFSSRYQPFILAYSYKTNYIPYLCDNCQAEGRLGGGCVSYGVRPGAEESARSRQRSYSMVRQKRLMILNWR